MVTKGKRKKVAVFRFAQESHPLSPLRTTRKDFESQHLFSGESLRANYEGGQGEAPGFIKKAELYGFMDEIQKLESSVELHPILSAWVVPGGPLLASCYDTFKDEILEGIRAAMPLDGVMASLHGSMGVDGMIDPEADIIAGIREIVGDVPIVVTLDLHANMTHEMNLTGAYYFAYHTNPHRDFYSTGKRAAKAMHHLWHTTQQRHVAWRSLPMLTGGGATLDLWPPMLSLFLRVKMVSKIPSKKILDASILMSNPWVNHPDLGWAAYAIGERDATERFVDQLADDLWAVRNMEPPKFLSPDEAVKKVKSNRGLFKQLGAVLLHDASDVVTAGSTGDNPVLLEALLNQPELKIAGALFDAPAVQSVWEKPLGETYPFSLGGAVDKRHHPFAMDMTLMGKHEDPIYGKRILLKKNDSWVVVSDKVVFTSKPEFFSSLGIRIKQLDAVIVKNFFPPLIWYAGQYGKAFFVKTKGLTDFETAKEIPYNHPVHPFAVVEDYRRVDKIRRHCT